MTDLSQRDDAEQAPSPALAPPAGNPRFALFDAVRGLAALAIMAYHVAGITGALGASALGDLLAVMGPRSLIVFFVLSGFLLYRPFVANRAAGRPPPQIGRYARSRALRILPAYWLALTVLAIFPGIVGVFSEDWWRYYGFLQLYSQETLPHGIPVAWSLCVEVTFYLLLPLWALGVRRLPKRPGPEGWLAPELVPLALVGAFGAAVQVAGGAQLISDLASQSLLGQSVWLALGMALAVLSVAVDRRPREPAWVRMVVEHPSACWAGAAVAMVLLTVVIKPGGALDIVRALATRQPVAETLLIVLLTAVMAALLVLPAVFGQDRGGLPRRLLAWRPVAWLGVISYGLFLWHLTIAQVLALPADPFHWSGKGLGLLADIPVAPTLVLFVLTFAVTALAAAASYYFVELPFLRRKRR